MVLYERTVASLSPPPAGSRESTLPRDAGAEASRRTSTRTRRRRRRPRCPTSSCQRRSRTPDAGASSPSAPSSTCVTTLPGTTPSRYTTTGRVPDDACRARPGPSPRRGARPCPGPPTGCSTSSAGPSSEVPPGSSPATLLL